MIANQATWTAFNQSLAQFIGGWTALETSLGAISRLRQLEIDVKPEEDDDKVCFQPPKDWPSKGGVEIRGLNASYGLVRPQCSR
jgi:hypothetical protein